MIEREHGCFIRHDSLLEARRCGLEVARVLGLGLSTVTVKRMRWPLDGPYTGEERLRFSFYKTVVRCCGCSLQYCCVYLVADREWPLYGPRTDHVAMEVGREALGVFRRLEDCPCDKHLVEGFDWSVKAGGSVRSVADGAGPGAQRGV